MNVGRGLIPILHDEVAVRPDPRNAQARLARGANRPPDTPVMLPSGRLRLVTRPSFTGSPLLPKTTGIVVFAVLSASAPRVSATITAT